MGHKYPSHTNHYLFYANYPHKTGSNRPVVRPVMELAMYKPISKQIKRVERGGRVIVNTQIPQKHVLALARHKQRRKGKK